MSPSPRNAGEHMTKTELTGYISEVLESTLTECKSENPLESWSIFICRLDAKVRRRIGDELERQGKNRYTGQPEEQRQREKE